MIIVLVTSVIYQKLDYIIDVQFFDFFPFFLALCQMSKFSPLKLSRVKVS